MVPYGAFRATCQASAAEEEVPIRNLVRLPLLPFAFLTPDLIRPAFLEACGYEKDVAAELLPLFDKGGLDVEQAWELSEVCAFVSVLPRDRVSRLDERVVIANYVLFPVFSSSSPLSSCFLTAGTRNCCGSLASRLGP
jgi:hypothetical protein